MRARILPLHPGREFLAHLLPVAGGEMIALGANDPGSQSLVPVELGQPVGELLNHLRRERVPFRRIVNRDLQHPAVAFPTDLSSSLIGRSPVISVHLS
jgi:hypothetical protein